MEAWEEIPDGLLAGLQHPTVEKDALTYAYLEGGVRLITTSLETPSPQPGDHQFLRWVSRAKLFDELQDSDLNVGEASFRYRWVRHADYVKDLVAYIRWRRNQSVLPLSSPAPIELALDTPSPSAAIDAVARMNLEGLFANVYFPLQLVALAVTRASSGETDVVADFYTEATEQWSKVFETFLDRYSFSLRDEVALDDLVELLMAIGEGLALREIAEPTKGERKERRLRLQALAAMALLMAAVDDGDLRTIAERTDSLPGP